MIEARTFSAVLDSAILKCKSLGKVTLYEAKRASKHGIRKKGRVG